jgi:ATP-dependent DNA helicase RecQ
LRRFADDAIVVGMAPEIANDDVFAALRAHFGHQGFRSGQDAIVGAVLGGHDVLAVMPTGSGKSLGYQLPAVMLPGTTLVVSPLISLMKDQVDELNRRGIASGALHSLLPAASRRDVVNAARKGALRLLYVAPERFASAAFVELLSTVPVARFVVDEAHCVSEWGHDFRPDYRRLRAAAAHCRCASDGRQRPPIAAFTATATPEVRDDIVQLLGLEQPQVLVAGFDRPNIYLRVEQVWSEGDKDAMLPSLVRGRRALVYAATRKSAEAAASVLNDAGLDAAAYHAGLKDGERTRVQDAFAAGTLPVVCATNAFGMGIDRPDVDAVVHYAIPGSVEAYYQEIGRAGRDGRKATATLLWDAADVSTRRFLIDSPRRDKPGRRAPVDPAEAARRKELEHRKLDRMIDYANTRDCLRATILRYFGDAAAMERCGSCGNCTPGAADAFERTIVRKILSGVARSGERYGRQRIIAMLLGDIKDLPPALAHLSTTGLLRFETRDALDGWIQTAISSGLLAISSSEYRTLSLTAAGRQFMQTGAPDVRITRPTQRGPALSRYERLVELARHSRRDADWDDEDELLEATLLARRHPGRWSD